jgi:hypothetical protein
MLRVLLVRGVCLFAGWEDSFGRNRWSLHGKDIHGDAEKQQEYNFFLLQIANLMNEQKND